MIERYRLSLFDKQEIKGRDIGEAHKLFRQTYKVKAGKKFNRLLFAYGVKRIRYALIVIQQEMNPRKDSALHHFKTILSRMYPDIRVPLRSGNGHPHKTNDRTVTGHH